MKRTIITVICALCAIMPLFADGFSGSGSGTESDPYRIFNADQLNQVRNFLSQSDAYFSLEADIDLAPWLAENNPYEGWQPIGTSSSPFKGTFDGNGHTISNLTINRPSMDYVGLFGYVGSFGGSYKQGFDIHDVTLKNCAIIGNDYVGGIVGYIESYQTKSISISGCIVAGTIEGNDYVGGIVGFTKFYESSVSSKQITISTCFTYASIKGNTYIGGIVGYIRHSNYSSSDDCTQTNIKLCASASNIMGKTKIGGIVGCTEGNPTYPNISNCYTCGKTICGCDNIGGICGYSSGINITKNYSQNSIIEGNKYIGGITGFVSTGYKSYIYEGYITRSVAINGRLIANTDVNRICPTDFNGETGTSSENKAWVLTKMLRNDNEQKPVEGLADGTNTGLSALRLKATYQGLGWDFDETWDIQETETFTYLKIQTAPIYFTGTLKAGQTSISGQCVEDGTVTVRIGDKEYTAESSGNTWTVAVDPLQGGETAEITVRAASKFPSYPVYADIELTGSGTAEDPFLVATAADLRGVTKDDAYYRLTQDIDLTDWIADNSATSGWQPVGDDIYGVSIAELDGDGHKITGLWIDNDELENVGIFSRIKGDIKNLYVEIADNKTVSGTTYAGAIAGTLRGTITSSSVKGNMASGTYIGSIAGVSTGNIVQCYAEGTTTNTTASANVGGLVGKTSGSVSDSYTNVTINATGSGNYCGGAAGYNTGTVNSCYAEGNITGYSIGGVVGYNAESTAKISGCVALNSKLTATKSAVRVLGGYGSDTTTPGTDNYAIKTMVVSVNNVPQTIYDDPINGYAKTEEELMAKATYETLGWDFTSIWKIDESTSYPYQEPFNVPVTSITLNNTTAILTLGNSLQLTATVLPDDARNASVTWSSDNESVATVSESGKVTAIGEGEAVITVATNDGTNLTATCMVTVEKPSGISNTEVEELKTSVCDKTITLSSMNDNTTVSLYSADGRSLYQGASYILTVPTKGIYIITTGSRSYKVAVE